MRFLVDAAERELALHYRALELLDAALARAFAVQEDELFTPSVLKLSRAARANLASLAAVAHASLAEARS